MKNYESPVVLKNEELAEGVFTASGADGASSTDCWTVGSTSVQDWNGSHHVFQIEAKHSTDVVHITTQVVYTIKFSAPLENAYSEFDCTFSGNTAVVTRDRHANGYNSGDNVTFKVWAQGADEATTKALSITGISYVCRHETNVQGGND